MKKHIQVIQYYILILQVKTYSESKQYYYNILFIQIFTTRFDSNEFSQFLLQLYIFIIIISFNIIIKTEDKITYDFSEIKNSFFEKAGDETVGITCWNEYIDYLTSIIKTFLQIGYCTPYPFSLHDTFINTIISYSYLFGLKNEPEIINKCIFIII